MIEDVLTQTLAAEFSAAGKITTQEELDQVTAPFDKLFLPNGSLVITGDGYTKDELTEVILQKAEEFYEKKEKAMGVFPETGLSVMREFERVILLRVVDEYWMDHIDAMHELRQGVGLRAYSQVNPVDEYKREGFDMFEAMVNGIREEVVRRVFTAQVRNQSVQRRSVAGAGNASVGGMGGGRRQPVRAKANKIGRNDPCPCGKKRPNGLPMKYKDCCGRGVN